MKPESEISRGVAPLQVDTNHYRFGAYVHSGRWNSYWHQICEATKVEPGSALYVGVGDDIVASVLESMRVAVSRFDFDRELGPRYVGDVRHVDRVVGADRFDVVLCCQVLEHLPFVDFPATIEKLYSLSRKRLIISLPYAHLRLAQLSLGLWRTPRLNLDFVLPKFWRKWKFDGEHHWEVGTRQTPDRVVRAAFDRLDGRLTAFAANEYCYHRFYIVDRE